MNLSQGITGTNESFSSEMYVALRDLCVKYHIRTLKVFGSALDSTNGPKSDIDLLVEFNPLQVPGFAFARIASELSELLGVTVDLHTVASLSRYFRDEVVRQARVIYAEKE